MPILAGWLTGEQVPQNVIETVLTTMGDVLSRHGGKPSRIVQTGMGLVSYTNAIPIMQQSEPPVLDWTPDRRTFVYRRPLSGVNGLYYIEDWPSAGNLLFATEIQALVAVGVPRKLHLSALPTLLRYGCIPAPWTAFKNISIVPAGSILRWQRGKTVLNPSTEFRFHEPSISIEYEEAKEQLDSLLKDAVHYPSSSNAPTALLTKANTPSLLTTVLASQQAGKRDNISASSGAKALSPARLPRHTRRNRPSSLFTIAHYGYTKSLQERHIIEQIVERYEQPLLTVEGVDHPDFLAGTLKGIEAPIVDTRPIALHQLFHTVVQTSKAQIALTGLGASTLISENLPLAPEAFLERQSPSTLFTSLAQQIIQDEERWEDTLYARKLIRHAQQFSDVQQQHYYLNLHVWLPDYLVHPMQQLARQESITLHSPYLNSNIIERITRLPATFQNGSAKSSLLSDIATNYLSGINVMPHSTSLFFPMHSLHDAIQPDAPEILRQILSEEALKTIGIFEVQEVMKLLHQEKASRELLLVVTTQLLVRLFGMSL